MLAQLLSITTIAVMLHLPASAEEVPKSQAGLEHLREDHSARKIHQCELIASHANRGAKHLHAINVVAHGATVDLYNDGHLMKVTLGDEGTADGPVLLDTNGKQIELKYRDDYAEGFADLMNFRS